MPTNGKTDNWVDIHNVEVIDLLCKHQKLPVLTISFFLKTYLLIFPHYQQTDHKECIQSNSTITHE